MILGILHDLTFSAAFAIGALVFAVAVDLHETTTAITMGLVCLLAVWRLVW